MGDHYTAEQFINAIPGTGGIISAIARKAECDWHTAKKYCTEYATVKRVYDAEKEGVLDLAEAKLIEAIKDGDLPAIKFYLTTQGKDRGYTERHQMEHTGKDGGEIIFKVIYDDDGGKLSDTPTEVSPKAS
jgi:hypothetical protein